LCLLLEGSLSSHGLIELLAETSFEGIDLIELSRGCGKLSLSFLELDGTLLKHDKLGLHNLGLLMVVGHSSSPCAETFESLGGVGSDLGGEEVLAIGGLAGKVGFEKLDSLLRN
jgi:hypothetical protein